MRSIDIANVFLMRHGKTLQITNLSLNKLVYFAQVESLKARPNKPLFADSIQAWEFGPVEPAVYHAFKMYGNNPITVYDYQVVYMDEDPVFVNGIVDKVAKKYGTLTPFDLVNISHKQGGAWRKKYNGMHNVEITVDDIKGSADYSENDVGNTLLAAMENVRNTWPNALRMLEDS